MSRTLDYFQIRESSSIIQWRVYSSVKIDYVVPGSNCEEKRHRVLQPLIRREETVRFRFRLWSILDGFGSNWTTEFLSRWERTLLFPFIATHIYVHTCICDGENWEIWAKM